MFRDYSLIQNLEFFCRKKQNPPLLTSGMTLLQSPNLCSWISQTPLISLTLRTVKTASSSLTSNSPKISKKIVQNLLGNSGSSRFCSCCTRRHVLGAVLGTSLLPICPSFASHEDSTPQDSMV